jgi:mannan endo-1,4-beta-mannosidase
MKKLFLFIGLFVSTLLTHAQPMHVNGKLLKTATGNTVILRGMNYPIMDDGNVDLNNAASYQILIDQYAMTGANCIRIPWNTDGKHWRDGITPGTMQGYLTSGRLGEMIDYCFSKNLKVILEIHDLTCSNNWAAFNNTIVPFWTSAPVLSLINTRQSGLIVNIANEFGNDQNWGGDLNTFKTNYITAVQTLRTAGITVPIMIDAPNCGTASSSLVSIADQIVLADNLHSIIFSVHTYWSAYAASNAQIDSKMNEMNTSNACYVFGEIANKQDVGSCGDTDITGIYQRVLANACPMNMGWLAWCYNKDCSAAREVTNTGMFANLTTFGNDLVNNANYGLNSNSPCNGQNGVPLGLSLGNNNTKSLSQTVLYPNPGSGSFSFQSSGAIKSVKVYDATGREATLKSLSANLFEIEFAQSGIYWVVYILKDGSRYAEKILCTR